MRNEDEHDVRYHIVARSHKEAKHVVGGDDDDDGGDDGGDDGDDDGYDDDDDGDDDDGEEASCEIRYHIVARSHKEAEGQQSLLSQQCLDQTPPPEPLAEGLPTNTPAPGVTPRICISQVNTKFLGPRGPGVTHQHQGSQRVRPSICI